MTSVINHAHAGIYAGYGLLGAVVGTVEGVMVLAAQMVFYNLPKRTKEIIISNMILCNGNLDRQFSDDRKSWDYWAMFTQAYADGETGALSVKRSADRVIPAIFAAQGLEKKKLTSKIVDEVKLQESDFHKAVRVKVAALSDSATKIEGNNKLPKEAKSRWLKKVLFGKKIN